MQSKRTFPGILQKIMMLLLVFMVVFQVSTPPVVVAEAADAFTYYIQTAVDTSNWTIAAGVVNDKDALFGNFAEVKRIGSDNLKNLKASSESDMLTSMLSSMPSSGGGGDKDNKVLSFPGFDTDPGFLQATPQASTVMQDRAMFVKDSLVFDLNTAIKVVYGDKKWDSLDSFRESVVSILSAAESGGTVNGWTFTRNFSANAELTRKLANANQGVSKSNYVEVSKDSEKYYLMTGIQKYLDTMSETDRPSDPSKDAQYITWGTILYEALVNSTLEKDAVTADTVYNSTVQGLLEGAVTELFSGLLAGIRSLLGLWDLDQLIFNRGSRGSTGFVAGIFPSSWEAFIWTFFLITEVLSFAIIMMAIAKHIMQRAAATVNPAIRANLMEQIKDMAVGIILLILLPALLVGFMQLSASLVAVFDKMVENKSITDTLSHFSTGNSLAAIVVGFANLIINIYFNWFYIIREITVALLMVLSPIFVTWMCLGSEKKGMAMRWLMELLSNIFIQPIHALLFAFIVLLPSTGRPIESLVMLYCLIPLTALLKGLFFPGVSDMGHRMAGAAGARANAMAKKASMSAIGAGIGLAKGGADLARTHKEAKNAASSGESSSGDNNIKQKNVNTDTGGSNKKPGKETLRDEIAKGAGNVGNGGNNGNEGNEPGNTDGATAKQMKATAGGQGTQNKGGEGQTPSGKDPKEKADGPDMSAGGKDSIELGDEGGLVKNMPADGIAPKEDANVASAKANTEKALANPNEKPRPELSEFKSDLKEGLREAKAQRMQEKAERRARLAEGAGMFSAGARIVAGAAMTGAVRGWKGQVFADHTNNAMSRNGRADYASAYRAKAERVQNEAEAQQMANIRQGKEENMLPSIPHQQVGDDFMTTRDDAAANGLNNLERFKVDGEDRMAYEVGSEDLSAHDRESLEEIADNPEMKAMAQTAGFNVERIRNADGSDTGRFYVSVGNNGYTGAKTPEFRGSNIVHGGKNHNDLIPDAGAIRNMANEARVREDNEQMAAMQRREAKSNNNMPSVPVQRVGDDYCMTDVGEAEGNGLKNMHKSGRSGPLTYDVSPEDLSAHDRESLLQIADDPEMKEIAEYSGVNVGRIFDENGNDTGMLRVTIGDNTLTGAKAPDIQGDNIVHGGSKYNQLIPDANAMRATANDLKEYEGYKQAIDDRQGQMHEIESALTAGGDQELDMIKDRERAGYSTIDFANNAQAQKRASAPVAIAASIGGSKSIAGSGPHAISTFTKEQAENQGIYDLKIDKSTGEASYYFRSDEVSNGYLQVLAERLKTEDKDSVLQEYQKNGYQITEGTIQDEGGKSVPVTFVKVAAQDDVNPVLVEKGNTGGSTTYCATPKSTPIVPVVNSGGKPATEIISSRSERAATELTERVNQEYKTQVGKIPVPERTDAINRGEILYQNKNSSMRGRTSGQRNGAPQGESEDKITLKGSRFGKPRNR